MLTYRQLGEIINKMSEVQLDTITHLIDGEDVLNIESIDVSSEIPTMTMFFGRPDSDDPGMTFGEIAACPGLLPDAHLYIKVKGVSKPVTQCELEPDKSLMLYTD